jgi:type IV secretory pathway VirD2 relaxase
MYAETKDEFEIAVESTEANAVYAQDDRDVTREELDKLKKAWEEAIEGEGEVQTELKGRAFAQRIKELENAVIALEQKATEEA